MATLTYLPYRHYKPRARWKAPLKRACVKDLVEAGHISSPVHRVQGSMSYNCKVPNLHSVSRV